MKKAMTVTELVEQLQKMPPDAQVFIGADDDAYTGWLANFKEWLRSLWSREKKRSAM